MKRINDWIGYQTTNGVGTMWTAYLFFLWALLPLVMPQAQNVVQYVSQSVIQLVLLPIIIVGQNVAASITEKRDIETHDSVLQQFQMTRDENAELRQLVEGQAAIIVGQSDLMAEMEEVIQDLHQIAADLHDHHIGGREHKKVR